MPTLTVYHLRFSGGLHLGSHGVNLEEGSLTLPSDTIFAALVDAWRRAGGDPVAWVAPFVAEPPAPPFLLTSAFPYAGGVRFYPMPAELSRLLSPDTLRARPKALRRVRYLSEKLLLRALAGERLDDWLFPEKEVDEPERGAALQGGQYWLTVDEIDLLPEGMKPQGSRRHALRALPVALTARVPRVTVNRHNAASTIYHVGRTTFGEGCGLWFGVQWREPAAQVGQDSLTYGEALAAGLAMLADDGLGGERTAGYGTFTLRGEPATVPLPDAGPERVAWLLSRYHPHTDEELAGLRQARSAYHLVKVGGWLRSYDHKAVRRRRLMLLSEGSVLPLARAVAGDVVDVRPRYPQAESPFPHPVYRYGLALGVGWQEASHG